MMKKVLHIISTDVYSGAENVACQIINIFKQSYDMSYVAKMGSNKEKLDSLKIKYIPIKKMNYLYLKRVIKKEKPDILHAHDAKACVIASMFSKKCEVIGHIHGNHENMRTKTIKSFLIKVLSKKMKKIIWVTPSAFNDYYYKKNVLNKSIVIENVIDINKIKYEILNDKNDYPVYDLVYLGRLSYPKNPIRLIEILKKIKKDRTNIKVAIIGTGEFENYIRTEIDNSGLGENVDMYGFVSNPYKILNQSKIMIMTSRYEGVPMCALEAVSLGIPIVSTPTDGIKNIIEHGKNGYLCDDDEELASYILHLLNDNNNYEVISKYTLKKGNEINDLQEYKNKIERVYESED